MAASVIAVALEEIGLSMALTIDVTTREYDVFGVKPVSTKLLAPMELATTVAGFVARYMLYSVAEGTAFHVQLTDVMPMVNGAKFIGIVDGPVTKSEGAVRL